MSKKQNSKQLLFCYCTMSLACGCLACRSGMTLEL